MSTQEVQVHCNKTGLTFGVDVEGIMAQLAKWGKWIVKCPYCKQNGFEVYRSDRPDSHAKPLKGHHKA